MHLTLGSLLLGIAALLVLWVGIWGAMLGAVVVQGLAGPAWGMTALGVEIAVLSGIAWTLWHFQDRLLVHFGPLIGIAPPEKLYCQVCGAASRADTTFCHACGGTRFALSTPSMSKQTGWYVQIGMDVIGADESAIGVVKQRRASDFLVSRPRQRDVYVPFSAITAGDRRTIRLNVSTTEVDEQAWEQTRFFNRPSSPVRKIGGSPGQS